MHGGGNTSVKIVPGEPARRPRRGALREGQRLGPRLDRAAGVSGAGTWPGCAGCASCGSFRTRRWSTSSAPGCSTPARPIRRSRRCCTPSCRMSSSTHTHADAILALTNQPDGAEMVRQALGERVVVVPYVMPGFQLAKLAAELFESRAEVDGMVLLKHGLFTFASDARTSYERTIEAVDRAEGFLSGHLHGRVPAPAPPGEVEAAKTRMARIGPLLRGLLATPSGNPDQPYRRVILEHRATPEAPRTDRFCAVRRAGLAGAAHARSRHPHQGAASLRRAAGAGRSRGVAAAALHGNRGLPDAVRRVFRRAGPRQERHPGPSSTRTHACS